MAPKFADTVTEGSPIWDAAAALSPDGPLTISGTAILAKIGAELVLEGDVLPSIDHRMSEMAGKIPPSQRDEIRKKLVQQSLLITLRRKIVYLDARREIPKENFPKVLDQLDKAFYGRLEEMMAEQGISSREKIEETFRKQGTSLDRQRDMFRETLLAKQWENKNSQVPELVTRAELWDYYQAHLPEYATQARAKYEELMIRFKKMPNKQAAYQAIAALGDRAYQGEDFATLAKSGSHGMTASAGGKHDWTTQGSLVHERVDEALFQQALGELGPILESRDGLHIVRVIERQPDGHRPFPEVQQEIREKILEKRREVAREKYFNKLCQGAEIWIAPEFDAAEIHEVFAPLPTSTASPAAGTSTTTATRPNPQ